MCLQVHRVVQNPADLHDAGFGHAVQQEMTWTAYPVAGSTRGFAAEEEMIGSAMAGDFGPLTAAGKFRIGCDFPEGGCQEFCVTPQSLWPKILCRPGKD